jgi:hypothetical protein
MESKKKKIIKKKLLNLKQNEMIKFALFCAEDVFHFNNAKTLEPAKNCIDLVKKYLADPNSVTEEELESASTAADVASKLVISNWSKSIFDCDAYYSIRSAGWSVVLTARAIHYYLRCTDALAYGSVYVLSDAAYEAFSTAISAYGINAYGTAKPLADYVIANTNVHWRIFGAEKAVRVAADAAADFAYKKYQNYLNNLTN